MEQEFDDYPNPFPICPECGNETYTAPADDDYYNVWCTGGEEQECEWFAEVDIIE